jgi:hypothetical protein
MDKDSSAEAHIVSEISVDLSEPGNLRVTSRKGSPFNATLELAAIFKALNPSREKRDRL